MTIEVIVHDKMVNLRQQGADGGHLSHEVSTGFEMISSTYRISEPKKEGTVKFEYWLAYKSQLVVYRTNHGTVRLKLLSYLIDMDPYNFDDLQDLWDSVMLMTEVSVSSPTLVVRDIPQIPIQIVGLVQTSP